MGQQKLAAAEMPEMGFVDELEPGTRLMNGQYTITRFLNNGGFGITYLAKDSLDRDIVIKECFPNAFCRRSKTLVAARSRAHQGELRSVVKLFVQEARNLSKLIHPNIVGVHQVFEDNDTAYMAIDYIKGRDLLQIIEDDTVALHPDHIVQIAEKMVSAVGFVHDRSVLHRDISPDNILLTDEGEPILIDFGAAREQASKKSRALTALRVVKDGYSPQEFYIAGSEQGPWSDLYALAATFYHLISGEAPVNGQSRLAALAEGRPDPYSPLTGRISGFPDGFLEAIDKAMQALPRNRLQSAQEWVEMWRNPPAPTPVKVDGEPELVIARMIADVGVIAPEPVPESRPEPIVAETQPAPERRRINPELAKRFAELTVPLEEPDEETDEETAEAPSEDMPEPDMSDMDVVEETEIHTVPASMPKLAPQAELDKPKPQTSRGILLTATALTTIVSAGVLAFVFLGSTDTGVTVPTEQPVVVAPLAETPEIAAAGSTGSDTTGVDIMDPQPIDESAVVERVAPVTAVATSPKPRIRPTIVSSVPPVVAPEPEQPAVVAIAEQPAPTIQPEQPVAAVVPVQPVLVDVPEQPAVADQPAEPVKAVVPDQPAATVVVSQPAPEVTAVAPANTDVPVDYVNDARWDVRIPFEVNSRADGDVAVAVITRVLPDADLSETDGWLRPGTAIFAVNGVTLTETRSIASIAATEPVVDADGFIRLSVRYKEADSESLTEGSLAARAVRHVGLVGGTEFEISLVEGTWRTVVTAVGEPMKEGLQVGDTLFASPIMDSLIDGQNTLEAVIAVATIEKLPVVEFNVLRESAFTTAVMPLVAE